MRHLHIDIETFSSVDIKSAGAYRYAESEDFEILLIAYSFDDGPVLLADLARGEQIPKEIVGAFNDSETLIHAHNAAFERICFGAYGLRHPLRLWRCSAVKASYCGLPLSLADVSKALELKDDSKDAAGKALIRYFCTPCKPTRSNGMRLRNRPEDAPDKWDAFVRYCIQDVVAEKSVCARLAHIDIPESEQLLYAVDQSINDRGVGIDAELAANAVALDLSHREALTSRAVELTGLDNPNSVQQLKDWLGEELGESVGSLNKAAMPALLEKAAGGKAAELLSIRTGLGRTSVKKYKAMLGCRCGDGRAHGLVQFYGAGRTGRWAGRLVQVQNLPQNHLKDLDSARGLLAAMDADIFGLLYDVPDTLSQLIRTAFVPKRGHTFAVADFSAIEARVIAWLSGERWRMDVFATHGKIYEASAAAMFGVPIEKVTKGSDLRQKGKIAELALGYQGGVGALKTMGGERMGLSETEMETIVKAWRGANSAITAMWYAVQDCAIKALNRRAYVETGLKGIAFDGSVPGYLFAVLPSGRRLCYYKARLAENRFGGTSIKYAGNEAGRWGWVESYGGKLTENLVQAVARDLLAHALIGAENDGLSPVMHVHDEIVCEVPETSAADHLEHLIRCMEEGPAWAEGLPLRADGYLTPYYKKD